MALVDIMSYVTVAVTLMMIMTGIPPCLNMYRTKSTANVPYHMFLLSALGCQGMLHYGLLLSNNTLIFLNGVGLVMQSVYVGLFILVSKAKTRPLIYLVLAILYDILLYAYMYNSLDEPMRRADLLGSCSSLVTTLTMTLPALEVIGNIRNKNADGMPQIMLLGGLLCSSCWLVYGMMLNDPNIYSPNIPGIVIAVTKLYIIWLYSDKSDKRKRD